MYLKESFVNGFYYLAAPPARQSKPVEKDSLFEIRASSYYYLPPRDPGLLLGCDIERKLCLRFILENKWLLGV